MKFENIFLQVYIHTCMAECTNRLVVNKSRKLFKQVMLQPYQNTLPTDASSNSGILGHSVILSSGLKLFHFIKLLYKTHMGKNKIVWAYAALQY